MDNWYYKVFGIEFGPVKFERLIELAKSHGISHDDQVRFGEKGNWRRAGSMGQLMAHLPFAPTPKPHSVASSKPANKSSASEAHDSEGFPVNGSATEEFTLVEEQPQDTEHVWWCKCQNREYGPVDLPTLIEWAATGRLQRGDQVRFGQDPYIPAGDLPGLFPEPPPASINGNGQHIPPIQRAS